MFNTMKFFCLFFVFIVLFIFSGFCQQRIDDFYLSNLKSDGSRDWDVEGEKAFIYDEYIDIDKMKANHFSENDTIVITSNRARLNKENMDVKLRDNIEIVSSQGAVLKTDSLDWQRSLNRIETTARVVAERNEMKIVATGLTADTEFRRADFSEDVEAVFSGSDESGAIAITCSGPLEIEYSAGKAVFNDNVVVTHSQGKLFSDKATIYFDIEAQGIVKIVSQGNVKIVRDGNVTFAQTATYFRDQDRIVLEGRPRLIYFPGEGGGNTFFP